jgi:hypothetical protein
MTNEMSGRSLLWETIRQHEAYPIFRLTYLSRPTNPFTEADFDDIEAKSVQANNARDVTGLLIVQDERILQTLEGRKESVLELYAKIEADPRHTIIKVVSEIEDDERLLLTWSMVVRGTSGIPKELLEQYIQVYDEMQHAAGPYEITIDHIDLFKTISLLAPLPA